MPRLRNEVQWPGRLPKFVVGTSDIVSRCACHTTLDHAERYTLTAILVTTVITDLQEHTSCLWHDFHVRP